LLSVIYTISDPTVVPKLKALSGHTNRMTVQSLPAIPTDLMVCYLSALQTLQDPVTQEKVADTLSFEISKLPVTDRALWFLSSAPVKNIEGKVFVIPDQKDSKYVVHRLGSHIQDNLNCFKFILGVGGKTAATPREAVQNIIAGAVGSILDIFLRRVASDKNNELSSTLLSLSFPMPRLRVIAATVFNSLIANDIVDLNNVITCLKGTCIGDDITLVVDYLVSTNVLTFADVGNNPLAVSWHSPKLRYAYLEAAKNTAFMDAYVDAFNALGLSPPPLPAPPHHSDEDL